MVVFHVKNRRAMSLVRNANARMKEKSVFFRSFKNINALCKRERSMRAPGEQQTNIQKFHSKNTLEFKKYNRNAR